MRYLVAGDGEIDRDVFRREEREGGEEEREKALLNGRQLPPAREGEREGSAVKERREREVVKKQGKRKNKHEGEKGVWL